MERIPSSLTHGKRSRKSYVTLSQKSKRSSFVVCCYGFIRHREALIARAWRPDGFSLPSTHLPAISASVRDLPHAPRCFRLRLGIQGRMQRARHHSSDQFQHRLDDLETPSRSGAFAVFKFSTAPSLRSLHAPFLAHTEVACTWITGEIALFHQDAVRFGGRHHVGHGCRAL